MFSAPAFSLVSGLAALIAGWPAFATMIWAVGVYSCLQELWWMRSPPPREDGVGGVW